MLQDSSRDVVRTSIDGFHRPRSERYARGRFSAEGYYFDARDLAAVRRLLLDSLGATGNRLYQTASFDLRADRAVEYTPTEAAADTILIVDGTFLQRAELQNSWDRTIFLQTSQDVAEQRGVARDLLSGGDDAGFLRELYARRYRPAYTFYERECKPFDMADAVVDNDNFEYPILFIRLDGRFAMPHR